MPITLHAAFIPSARQMLGTTQRLVETAEAWCRETGTSEGEVIGARLHPDMLPFAYQVKSVAEHSAGALRALDAGVFSPHLGAPPQSFADLLDYLKRAQDELESYTEASLEARIGTPMRFEFKEMALPFTAENFLLSFSQPNFYFHAATAYAILRQMGVPVGKRNFLGAMRIGA